MKVYEKLTLYFIGMAAIQPHIIEGISKEDIFRIITNTIVFILFTIMFIITIIKFYKNKS
jgi:hypothetical protein